MRLPSTCATSSTTASRKPSTVRGYRSVIHAHLLPAFGEMAVEDVTAEVVEGWMASFEDRRGHATSC